MKYFVFFTLKRTKNTSRTTFSSLDYEKLTLEIWPQKSGWCWAKVCLETKYHEAVTFGGKNVNNTLVDGPMLKILSCFVVHNNLFSLWLENKASQDKPVLQYIQICQTHHWTGSGQHCMVLWQFSSEGKISSPAPDVPPSSWHVELHHTHSTYCLTCCTDNLGWRAGVRQDKLKYV